MNFYILDEDLSVPIGCKKVSWYSNDQDWFFIESGVWWIKQFTIWDGVTLFWEGRPDPNKSGYPKTWLATLVHDLGRYYIDDPAFPYSRQEIDKFFYNLLRKAGSPLALPYYAGVVLFGGLWERLHGFYLTVTRREQRLPSHLSEEPQLKKRLKL